MMSKFATALLVSCAAFGLGTQAKANSLDQPGSLLLFPIFDNTRGGAFALTVTNTNADTTQVGQLLAGTVDVEFVYVNGYDCLEFNRTRRLTPNDTITVLTIVDNPNMNKGYVYVFAKSPTSGAAIKWDFLEGDSAVLGAANLLVGDLPPVVYKAGAGLAHGAPTDVDGDGLRDLNGTEYATSADELHIPRFVAFHDSNLILIALTGGKGWNTIVNFLAYNDNEEVFSGQVQFSCWERRLLRDISGVFTNTFLQSTNHNLSESIPVPGGSVETGWIRMWGNLAYSSAAQVSRPAFLAVRVDDSAFVSLPYGIGSNAKGDLIVNGPFPDATP